VLGLAGQRIDILGQQGQFIAPRQGDPGGEIELAGDLRRGAVKSRQAAVDLAEQGQGDEQQDGDAPERDDAGQVDAVAGRDQGLPAVVGRQLVIELEMAVDGLACGIAQGRALAAETNPGGRLVATRQRQDRLDFGMKCRRSLAICRQMLPIGVGGRIEIVLVLLERNIDRCPALRRTALQFAHRRRVGLDDMLQQGDANAGQLVDRIGQQANARHAEIDDGGEVFTQSAGSAIPRAANDE